MTRRSAVANLAASALLAPALLVVSAGSAQASTIEADETGAWLASYIETGVYSYDSGYGEYPDYGLTLDIVIALNELGVEQAARNAVLDGLAANPSAYGVGSAGGSGKLAVALLQNGRSATDLGGRDVLADVASMVVTEGPEAGRGVDSSEYGDYSSGHTQPFVVSSLLVGRNALGTSAATFLLDQQCDDGGFRAVYSEPGPDAYGANGDYIDPAVTCESDVDATLAALTALNVAKAFEVTGAEDAWDDGIDYVLDAQAEDGSFSGAGFPSTNSTGRAAWLLATTEHQAEALKAANWVRAHRVHPGLATGPLAGETGAIAKSPEQFTDAATYGVEDAQRHEWVRATSEAALALFVDDPEASASAVNPPAEVEAGSDVTFVFDGLYPGEEVRFEFETSGGGGQSAFAAVSLPTTVRADLSGRAQAVVTVPAALGPRTLYVLGLGSNRVGSTTFTVVPAAPVTGPGSQTPGGTTSNASSATGSTGNRLPSTGSSVEPGLVALAVAAIAVGAGLVVRRKMTA